MTVLHCNSYELLWSLFVAFVASFSKVVIKQINHYSYCACYIFNAQENVPSHGYIGVRIKY